MDSRLQGFPDPLRIQKMEPPNMNPLLHRGNWGIIRGLHFLDPLAGLGWESRARACSENGQAPCRVTSRITRQVTACSRLYYFPPSSQIAGAGRQKRVATLLTKAVCFMHLSPATHEIKCYMYGLNHLS